MTTTNHIEEFNVYQLAHMADCAGPDSNESPGAKFLASVQDAVHELIADTPDSSDDDRRDEIFERIDGVIPIYTYDVWSMFTDLAAYQEDLEDLGGYPGDMEKAAKCCLLIIGERLAYAILDDLSERLAYAILDDLSEVSE